METYMWIVWLAIFVIAIIVEISTTELVSIFFCLGSLVALIISFISGVPWWVQLIVFVVLSGASMLGLRPLIKKVLSKEKRDTNVDEFIGKRAIVIGINNDGYPEIKMNGLIWRIVNINEDEKIDVGDKVEIVSINGNKLIVRKVGK